MPSYYTYLISSLPMLIFGARPPISHEKFLNLCQGQIPDEQAEMLKGLSLIGEDAYRGKNYILDRYLVFDTALRNELVKIRAGRIKIDPSRFLRHEECAGPEIAHLVMNAYRSLSIIEGERILDQARWNVLEELTLGHYFDFEFLLTYALKLLILERWERTRLANKASLSEEAVNF